jgi:hypothetical protein
VKLLAVLYTLIAFNASADSYYSKQMNEELGINILSAQLNKINGTAFTVGKMMYSWIDQSQKENHLCDEYPKENSHLNLMCIRHDLLKITHQAYRSKKIDEVENQNLTHYLNKLTIKEGKIAFLPIKPSLTSRWFNRKQKRVDVPALGDYKTSANFFRNRRIQMNRPADLDPEVLALLKDAYRRRIINLGRVTPDQYLLSKYSASQINLMSDLILETMNWTDEKVTAEIILDRVGLREKKSRLNQLQSQFSTDAMNGMSPETLQEKTTEIENLKKEIELADTAELIMNLNDQRYELSIELVKNPSDDLDQQILALSDQIEELESKLEGEITIVPLAVGDIHRLAMNHLENMIEIKRREQGALKNFNGTLADLLVASYITGETDGESLKALLKIKDYQEIHESLLLKTGKFIWTAGRTFLMMNPYTVIPTTLVSVAISAFQKKKEYEKTMAEKTYLIRQ